MSEQLNPATGGRPSIQDWLQAELNPQAVPTEVEHALELSVLWGDTLLDEVQVTEPRAVTVGARTGGACDLKLDGALGEGRFVIADHEGGAARLSVPKGAEAGLRRADGSVEPAAGEVRIGLGERLVYRQGGLTVLAHFVRGDARPGDKRPFDWYFSRVVAISLLLHLFLIIATFLHQDIPPLDGEHGENQEYAQAILMATIPKPPKRQLDLSEISEGGRHKGEEGKFGRAQFDRPDAARSKAGAPRVDPNKREKDRKIALNAGLLGILKGGGGGGAVSNVFGPGGLGTGVNNALGGLRGTSMGEAGGAGGLGSRGTGSGGGGNSLGIGGLGTQGRGKGGAGRGGYGDVRLGGGSKRRARLLPGRTIIKGALSKAEISRVIRKNLSRFKYCYEKQLNAHPKLAGKVSVYFTIAPTGGVAAAKVQESTMKNAAVEGCVTKTMRTLKFPKPKGGGIVVVTYPFVFAAT